MDEQPALKTERLLLRPFVVGDALAVQTLAGDQRVALMTGDIPYPYPDGFAERWISGHPEAWAQRTTITYAVCLRDGHTLVGCVGLRCVERHLRASLGYWIAVEHWGQGYCTEAASAVVKLGFDQLGLRRIEATHLPGNSASGAVMRKLGMRHEGVLRSYVIRDGESRDLHQYATLSTD